MRPDGVNGGAVTLLTACGPALAILHRLEGPPSTAEVWPRRTTPRCTLIDGLLNFCDKILRAAWVAGDIQYHNVRLMMFPDYTLETQKQRRSFDVVKAALRRKGTR